jgi:YbbR domain-containing protein
MIDFLRQLFFKDFWLKLFSLALSILIWLTVAFLVDKDMSLANTLTFNTRERTFFSLPVAVLSSAEDVRSFKVSPGEVEVTVQGDPRILKKLQNKDIRVLVDLTGIDSARYLRKRIEVSTPSGVTHVMVAPQEVEVIYPPKI